MGKYRELQIICRDCNGTGVKKQGSPETQEPCLDCQETGYRIWGRIKFKPGDFTED